MPSIKNSFLISSVINGKEEAMARRTGAKPKASWGAAMLDSPGFTSYVQAVTSPPSERLKWLLGFLAEDLATLDRQARAERGWRLRALAPFSRQGELCWL